MDVNVFHSIKRTVLGIYLVAFSGFVLADECRQESNKLDGEVGLDSNTGAVKAAGLTGHDNGCNCEEVFFLPTNTDASAAMSVVLAAKLAGKTIAFELRDDTNCASGFRVFIE